MRRKLTIELSPGDAAELDHWAGEMHLLPATFARECILEVVAAMRRKRAAQTQGEAQRGR